MRIIRQLKVGALVAVAMGTLVLSGFASAQTSTTLDLDLKDAGLVSAVQALTNRTGLQFVIADGEDKFNPITLSLRRTSAESAIEMMVAAAGGWVERNEAGVYIIRAGKPAPKQDAGGATAAPRPVMEIRKIRLLRADPQVVFQQLTNSYSFDPDSGLRMSNQYNRMITEGQSRIPAPNTFAIGQGVQSYTTKDLEQMGGRPVAPAAEGGNDIVIPGETARQLTPGGNFGGGPGAGGAGQGGVGGGGAGGGGAVQLTPGQGLVPDGIEYISYDPTDNSIVVRGTDDAIRRLTQAINLFDNAPKQVEVKVEFITTSQSVNRSFGIDWTFSRGAVFAGANPGAFARTGDPIFINYSTGNLVTRLRTRLLEGEGKVVSAPLVRTFNNQTGFITQTVTTTIFLPQTTVTSGVIQTNIVPQSLTVNTALIVRPRINGDGTVTMSLAPQVQDFGQIRRGPDGTEIPDQLSSAISVATRVKDGETIVLAGFTRKSTQTTINKFPILADLPIIGSLFRSTQSDRNDSELLIFVTPRVIQDEDDTTFTP